MQTEDERIQDIMDDMVVDEPSSETDEADEEKETATDDADATGKKAPKEEGKEADEEAETDQSDTGDADKVGDDSGEKPDQDSDDDDSEQEDSEEDKDPDSDGPDGEQKESRAARRIRKLAKRNQERAEENTTLQQQLAEERKQRLVNEAKYTRAEAERKADKLDPLDFDDDNAYEAARQEILKDAPDPEKVEQTAGEQADPRKSYEIRQAGIRVVKAVEGWNDAPEDAMKMLDASEPTDETVVAISKLNNPAQVAYELALNPLDLYDINQMSAADRTEVLKGLDEDFGAKATDTSSETEEKPESRKLPRKSTRPPAPGSGGQGGEDSIDAIEQTARRDSNSSLW